MPTSTRRPGRREYGVEDEAGNTLVSPGVTTKSAIRDVAARRAEGLGASVYVFEVGKDPSDGTSIVVDREEVKPAGAQHQRITSRKTAAQLDSEIDVALATPRSTGIVEMLRRDPYHARVTFSDRQKRFGPTMGEDRPRWAAFVQGVLGHDVSGEGITKEAAVFAALSNLPLHVRRHFERS